MPRSVGDGEIRLHRPRRLHIIMQNPRAEWSHAALCPSPPPKVATGSTPLVITMLLLVIIIVINGVLVTMIAVSS